MWTQVKEKHENNRSDSEYQFPDGKIKQLFVRNLMGILPSETGNWPLWGGPLYVEGGERPKEEAGHSWLVGGSFKKQRKLIYEACLVLQQDEWVPTSTFLRV